MSAKTIVACILGLLVPGAGHLFLQRWGRGLTFLAVVVALFLLGLALNGQLYGFTIGFFGILKFVAGVSTGVLYFLGKLAGWGSGDITAYGYEYGNTFLYTAGLLNLLIVVDVFDISQGRKS